MSGEYPDADWPDVERVVGVLLRPLVSADEYLGNFVVLDYDQQIGDANTPFITIHERGGELNSDDFTYFARIEVECWGKNRAVARSTMTKVMRIVLGSGGSEVAVPGDPVPSLIDMAEDTTGAEERALENPDDRCVTRMFTLGFRPMYQDA